MLRAKYPRPCCVSNRQVAGDRLEPIVVAGDDVHPEIVAVEHAPQVRQSGTAGPIARRGGTPSRKPLSLRKAMLAANGRFDREDRSRRSRARRRHGTGAECLSTATIVTNAVTQRHRSPVVASSPSTSTRIPTDVRKVAVTEP